MERSKEEELQELLASCSQFEQFLFFTLRDQVSKDKTTEEEPLPRLSPFELVLLFYLKSLVYSEKSIQETLVHQDTRCKSVIMERKAWRGFQQEFQVHSVMLKETESDLHKTTIKETEVQSGEGQSLPSFPEGFFTQAKHAERDQEASSGTQNSEEKIHEQSAEHPQYEPLIFAKTEEEVPATKANQQNIDCMPYRLVQYPLQPLVTPQEQRAKGTVTTVTSPVLSASEQTINKGVPVPSSSKEDTMELPSLCLQAPEESISGSTLKQVSLVAELCTSGKDVVEPFSSVPVQKPGFKKEEEDSFFDTSLENATEFMTAFSKSTVEEFIYSKDIISLREIQGRGAPGAFSLMLPI
ncbi:uncharacterized protein LOC129343069 isoform X2 [Eublepharis macularius]|uniref:Uncharacterized protein LOC129343069 isoform X2 n=1 Tax=Eublepharis macularius TaxID=481883 RepID=A0AA97LGB3_EUBMA|nr:uncharacterized protein LOC129343069 isoform X2 [Eublepharis macularius]